MQKDIFLPEFPWFYDSHLSEAIDYHEKYLIECLIEEWKLPSEADCDDLIKIVTIDYDATRHGIGEKWYNLFIEKVGKSLKRDTSIDLIAYVWIVSPRYYNYETDQLEMTIQYDHDKVIEYLNANREAFQVYITRHNTWYDWYIPNFSNDFNSYTGSYNLEPWELTQVIDFFIEQIDDPNLVDIDMEMSFIEEMIMELETELVYTINPTQDDPL